MKRGPELEAQVLGAVITSKEPLKLLQAAGLNPEAFSDPMHRAVAAVAWELAHRGQRVDHMTVFFAGRLTGRWKDEDLPVIQALEARATMNPQSFMQVANELRRHAHQQLLGQQMLQLGNELLGRVRERATAAQAFARFQAIGDNFRQLHTEGRRGSDAVLAGAEGYQARKLAQKPILVPSGLKLFDEKVGGFPPKLSLLLGPAGIGKSALLAAVIMQQLAMGLKPVLFSLEDGDEWLVKRHLAHSLGLKVRDVFAREFPDEAKAQEAMGELSNKLDALWIVTKRAARTAMDVIRISTQYLAQHGATHVLIDNMTALKHQVLGKHDEPRIAAGRSYEQLAEFADSYKTPVIALAHTNREYEKHTRGKTPPGREHVSETADAERYIRLLIGVWLKHGSMRLTVVKANEGETGLTFEYDLHREAALLDVDSERVVNVDAERRKESREAEARRLERGVLAGLDRKELAKKIEAQRKSESEKKPEEEKAPDPQQSLLDVPPTSKPESSP